MEPFSESCSKAVNLLSGAQSEGGPSLEKPWHWLRRSCLHCRHILPSLSSLATPLGFFPFSLKVFLLLSPPFCFVLKVVNGSPVAQVCPQGTCGNVWRQIWLPQLGEGVFWHQWAEARDAAQHPLGTGCPTTKDDPAPNSTGVRAKEPCDR